MKLKKNQLLFLVAAAAVVIAATYLYRKMQYANVIHRPIVGCNMIRGFPKSIFQTWKSHTKFPENFDYWRKTWKRLNPTYEYVLFDDSNNRDFIKVYFPWFLERFDRYDKPIKKADAIRYFYLYLHGGIYADLDFECLKPFDRLLEQYSGAGVLLGCMKDADDMAKTSANNIPNAIMISRPREDFWICMFHVLLERGHGTGDYSTENETGPMALKDAYLLYSKTDYKGTDWYRAIAQKLRATNLSPCADNGVVVLPAKTLYPISWEQPEMKAINNEMLHAKDRVAASRKAAGLFPDSFAATYWTHSWGDQ